MPTFIGNPFDSRKGRWISNRRAMKAGLAAGGRGGEGRIGNQVVKKPAPLNRGLFPRSTWDDSWNRLDLNRPRPVGMVRDRDLQNINPGLFMAWNTAYSRWEVWCRRDEWGMEPYFVFRCVIHPHVYDEMGRVLEFCPARPERFKMKWDPFARHYTGQPNCPPECPGVYAIPDSRLLRILYLGTVLTSAERQREIIEHMDNYDKKKVEDRIRTARQRMQDAWMENFNAIVGIESVGWTPTNDSKNPGGSGRVDS